MEVIWENYWLDFGSYRVKINIFVFEDNFIGFEFFDMFIDLYLEVI